jgi:hypothetical protein
MKLRWAPGIVASLVLGVVGCNNSQPRTLQGRINLSSYNLHQPGVLVESSGHASYVASVSASGRFSIAVPSGKSYRLTLTDRTSAGSLALVSRILWSGNGQHFVWGRIGSGSAVNFGLIRPLGSGVAGASQSASGSGNDQGENDDSQCDENDDAQGDEQGPAGTSGTCAPQTPPPSNPPLCMPGTMGNSSGDHDEGCDQDGNSQGDDDRDGNGATAGQCGDGGVMSGDDDNQGDDNAQGNEDQDDDGAGGMRCVKHVPPCPPAPPPGGGTPPPSGSPDMGTVGTPPPPAAPDMGSAPGTPGPIP